MSKGDTIVITIDFMMKFEEKRARESSREHYSKRGLSVHGAMIKYILNTEEVVKRLFFSVPEGDSAQDMKSALAHIDVIMNAIRKDPMFNTCIKIIILSDNAGTYSANTFHVVVFDVVKS